LTFLYYSGIILEERNAPIVTCWLKPAVPLANIIMEYSAKQIEIMNRTARSKGAVANNPPRCYRACLKHGLCKVLDYGAGPIAKWTFWLINKGYDVVAYDIGENFNSSIHDSKALSRKYPVVIASNVLNVQPTKQLLKATIKELESLVKEDGVLIVNYPRTPRKAELETTEVQKVLGQVFNSTKLVWFLTEKEIIIK